MLVLSQTQSMGTPEAVEDAFIIQSVKQVTALSNGAMTFSGANVIFRERKGIQYSLGTPTIQFVGANPNLQCLTLALASQAPARLVIRVKENEFTFKPGVTHDRVVINVPSVLSCSSVR